MRARLVISCIASREICPTQRVPRFQLSLVSTNARANPESGPKLPIVSLRLPTARQKIDQGWSLEALNWDNYVAHVQFMWRLSGQVSREAPKMGLGLGLVP